MQAGPLARKLGTTLLQQREPLAGLTYEALREQHRLPYLDHIDFDVSQVDHYQGFVDTFTLSSSAVSTLGELGFVVVPEPELGLGPADIYYRVFAADLPVFVSADSILHAWHRSFDTLLENTETHLMLPTLQQLLTKTMAVLTEEAQDSTDALFYLAVAQALIDPEWTPPARVAGEVTRFLEAIERHVLTEITFLGSPTYIDFSQFIPRGHYTNTEALKRYFMAMMWLGRTDLVLYDPTHDSRPREEAAARALAGAMQRGEATPLLAAMDRIYAVYVGRTNALTPIALLELCQTAKLENCAGAAAAMTPLYAEQDPPDYSSRVFAEGVQPITMRFFPQRFGYDAWVMAQTTTPRLEPAVQGGRAMAMPEDVAFVLGASRAIDYFETEMKRPYRENLPATLEALRLTMEAIPPLELEPTAYNYWLSALQALSRPGLEASLPQVMRTATWHDRKLEAVLASWAELRHDTILVVEQSTGGVGCQYPKGYVEPVPALYRQLAGAAAAMQPLYAELASSIPQLTTVSDYLGQFGEVMEQLAVIAEAELASQPMTEEQLSFLNRTVDEHRDGYAGARQYTGWYPRLFWSTTWTVSGPTTEDFIFDSDPSGLSNPIVADVHTDAENERALEVAVGYPGLMIVAIDNGEDRSLYGGPVSSYYSFDVALDQRMTDEAWQQRLKDGNLPPRPPFATAYRAE